MRRRSAGELGKLQALAAAAGEHPRARRRLLVLDRDAAGEIEAPGVEVLAAYDWMLAESE